MQGTSRTETREAIFVVTSLSRSSGGLTRSVLRRIRLFDSRGVPTTVLVLKYAHREDIERVGLRLSGALPRRTTVRYFWREGHEMGEGVPRLPLDGRMRRHRDRIGRVARIDRSDRAGVRTSVEHRSLLGRRVAVDHLDPGTGDVRVREMLDPRGGCWLRVEGAGSHDDAVVLAGADPGMVPVLAAAQARWVAGAVGDRPGATVFFDGFGVATVPTHLEPGALRVVSVLHNPHTEDPADTQSPVAPHWEPVLRRDGAVSEVVVLTESQRRDAVAHVGPPPPVVIPHGVPPRRPGPEPRAPRVVVAGRLVRQKRVDHAVRAFASIAREHPTATLDVVGDGPARGAVERLVDDLGLTDRVVLHGYRHDVHEVFARAAVGLLSSRYEGWALTLTEAMSVGTPCVAYDVPYGPSTVIRHGVDGVLVPPGDVQALAAAASRLLAEEETRREMSRRALEVTTRFAEEDVARRWMSLLEPERP